MRTYGIVVAWGPGVELRGEGLSAMLAHLSEGLLASDEVRIVVACPGWGRETIRAFLKDAGIGLDRVEFHSTDVPYSVAWMRRRKSLAPALSSWSRRWRALLTRFRRARDRTTVRVVRRLVVARTPSEVLVGVVAASPWIVAGGAATVVGILRRTFRSVFAAPAAWGSRILSYAGIDRRLAGLRSSLSAPLGSPALLRWYEEVLSEEFRLLKGIMASRTDVRAWLCPTAFWPDLCDADVPLVVSIPDLNPVDLPVSFAAFAEHLPVVERVRRTARIAPLISVYSRFVAERQLVDRLGIEPSRIRVIPHGTTSMRPLIEVRGTTDDHVAGLEFCRDLFLAAVRRSNVRGRPVGDGARRWKFILFPSQLRPNKNIPGLIDAYEILLRRHLIHEKLVLTATPNADLLRSISAKGLQQEVLFLPGLSDQELAACYRLATVAISPTLAEGACPFMIAEALSIGTPVLVSDIPVVSEIVDDPVLRSAMTFDPHRTESMVERILWAVNHRSELLELQRPLWDRLSCRTWSVAAQDYLAYLEDARAAWVAAPRRADGTAHIRPRGSGAA